VTVVELEGRQLKLSNLEKVLYPEAGFTKGQVIDYYHRIAPALLPQIKGRPLTLKRYPNGVDGGYFYEKQCPSHRPPWVRVAPVRSGQNERTINFCLVEDLPTLIWVANLASLELHTALHRAAGSKGTPDERWTPDMVVFDLDPGEPAALRECAEVALWLRESLDGLGLASWAKTSGSKGLQVYVPLNTPVTYDQTKGFARALAQVAERALPGLVVSNMAKDLRKGKVLIDWSQNDEHKTTVSVYSLRARPRPTVSAPLQWAEVEAAAAGGPAPAVEAGEAVSRFAAAGDLFRPLLDMEQRLPVFG
jgi:bifunctional non-homologous end joining protein LigD